MATQIATVESRVHEPVAVSGLVALAIEKGVDVEVLERLVALQERVTERNARAAFFEALAKFREACPPIRRTRENSQFKVTRDGVQRASRYAPLDEIDRIARPVASSCGLTWTWDTRVEGDLLHVTCRVMHVMGHSETTVVSMPVESKAGSSAQQKYGSAQTYGMRYSLIAALGITTADEDMDGAGGEVEKITEFIGEQRGYPDAFQLPEVPTEDGEGGGDLDLGDRDSMFEEAARVVVQTQQGSTSLIQRKLKLGYNRAGRIVDQLEAAGILGPFEGSKARRVMVPNEAALDALLHPAGAPAGPGMGGF